MDSQTSKLVDQLSQAHWFAVTLTALSIVLTGLLAFLMSYTKKKGEQFATREDFKRLLSQTEQTVRTTELIKAGLSAGTSVGTSELEYRKAQLAEFYGPIYSRLKLSRELYKLWMAQKLHEVNLDLIDVFRHQNEAIVNIITDKAHLIDDAEIPPVFTRYMTSVTVWGLYTSRPHQPWIEQHVASLPEVKWPGEFEQYIVSKTQELKRRLDELHRKHTFLRGQAL